MPWACTAEEIPIAEAMLGIVDGLRKMPEDTTAEMVWKKAW